MEYTTRITDKKYMVSANSKSEARAELKKILSGWKEGEEKKKWKKEKLPTKLVFTCAE